MREDPTGAARDRPRRRAEVPATLVTGAAAEVVERTWTGAAQRLVSGPLPGGGRGWAPTRVTGGPGTGKSSLVVDVAVSRLTATGADPESVLVLASDRRAAVRLREQITRRVLADPGRDRDVGHRSTREPLVRTVHSYAFAVLRLQASANGNPLPRLITGSEQDAVLRELLAGDIADGARHWPERLRPALHTDGFAQALRDLIMRAAERGVGPEKLITLGRAHGRDEWIAAGVAYRQYEQTTLLRAAVGSASPQATAPAVDAAELIGSALTALSTDDELLAGERARIRHLLVDDAHHLDPQAAHLVRLVGTGAETVVAGDRDQTVFAFRGASPRFLDELVPDSSDGDDSDHDVVLDVDRRAVPEISAVVDAIAARLPGRSRPARRPAEADDGDRQPVDVLGAGPAVRVEAYGSAAKEATAIADALRRAHVFEGVPWSRMAIVARSVARSVPALRRALRATGVPVVTPASELPLHRQRAVAALLSVLRAVDGSVDGDEALALLSGPVGGADPTAVRRLRRGLRRTLDADPTAAGRDSIDVIVAVLADDDGLADPDATARFDALTAAERAPLARVRDVVRAARREERRGGGVEDVLWAAWEATGLARRWSATALRGGPAADQADRDLDAVVALFDVAAGFTDNLPAAGIAAFVDHVGALRIAGEAPRRNGGAEAVTIVSAHAAAGREWDVVAVAGVQDGLWPALRSRGGILGTPALVDLLDGVAVDGLDTVSRTAVALADERRLFLVACSRARRRLLVTAVDDGGGDAAPSRFLVELAALVAGEQPDDEGVPIVSADGLLEVAPAIRRTLSLPSIVAALRARVAQPDPDPRVAQMLARLADAGVPGAHPDDWFGVAEPSTDAPLWDPARGPITVSPSSVEAIHRCSLRWMFERAGGRDGDSAPAVAGTVVHTLVQALAGQIPPDDVTASLRRIWDQVDVGAQWYSAHELDRVESMLDHFGTWLERSRGDLEEIGVEVEVDVVVPPGPDADPEDPLAAAGVRIKGRIDRLERDGQGRPVVVDVKTGKSAVSKEDAAVHPQLATYQLAVHLGGVEGVARTEPGGGRLVYVSSSNKTTGAAERVQPPLTADHIAEWTQLVREAARRSAGPRFVATVNAGCVRCPLTASCPASLAGKAVTDD
ncbi:ATP-dependent helicase [Williamsia sp. SKLECPSW1]